MKQLGPLRVLVGDPVPETITTARLVLRAPKIADVPAFFKMGSDDRVSRYVLWDTHRTQSESRDILAGIIRRNRQGGPFTWMVVRQSDSRPIGTIGFVWTSNEHMSAEIGYSFAYDTWGQGYATEALKAFIDHAFSVYQYERLEGQHDKDNPASGRVLEKAGMRAEGLLRKRLINKGRHIDTVLFAIVREDWAKARASHQAG